MIEVPNVKYQLTFALDTSPILEILYFTINKKNLFSDVFILKKEFHLMLIMLFLFDTPLYCVE